MSFDCISIPNQEQALVSLPFLSKETLSIYVHFPWCLQKCHYCDFYSLALNRTDGPTRLSETEEGMRVGIEPLQPYLHRLERELEERLLDQSSFHNFSSISSIYFGGGTPSLLPSEEVARLIEKFRSKFVLADNCEITLEGNPENMTPAYLSALYDAGINRVNVGIQTFQPQALQLMNRYFSAERYAVILDDLKSSPLSNFGVDLIYGFPRQTQADFYRDLFKVFAFDPPHLSLYNLTVETGTAYEHAVQAKRLSAPDDELQAQIWEDLPSIIQGYSSLRQYEVSNFATDGHECRHNLHYWLYEPYLGLGPGAHGFDGHYRYANPRSLQQWFNMSEAETYSVHEPLLELPLMLLRISRPLSLALWEYILLKRYNLSVEKLEQAIVCMQDWVDRGLAEFRDGQNNQRYFQWKQKGLSFLNDRVLEMHQAFM